MICVTNTPFRSSASRSVVSFAAVIRVVTQRSSLLTTVGGEGRSVTTLITATKEASRSKATYFVYFCFRAERRI